MVFTGGGEDVRNRSLNLRPLVLILSSLISVSSFSRMQNGNINQGYVIEIDGGQKDYSDSGGLRAMYIVQ